MAAKQNTLAHLPAFGVLLRRGVDGQQRENE